MLRHADGFQGLCDARQLRHGDDEHIVRKLDGCLRFPVEAGCAIQNNDVAFDERQMVAQALKVKFLEVAHADAARDNFRAALVLVDCIVD